MRKQTTSVLICSYLIGLTILYVFLPHMPVSAQSPDTSNGLIQNCVNFTNSFSTYISNLPTQGFMYIKLANQQEVESKFTLYFENNNTGQCQLLGQVAPTYSSWLKLGYYHLQWSSGNFVAVGNSLSSGAYQAAVSILMITNPSICNPLNGCIITFNGFKGTLEPQQLSDATSELGIYSMRPLQNTSYSQVSYYADGEYVYGSNKLTPFNRDYLSGGQHSIIIQVLYKNGDLLNIHQSINMGTDYTGRLWITSIAYREHDQLLLFLVPSLIFMVILSIAGIIHNTYRRHLYRKQHGLDSYIDAPGPEDHNHVVIG